LQPHYRLQPDVVSFSRYRRQQQKHQAAARRMDAVLAWRCLQASLDTLICSEQRAAWHVPKPWTVLWVPCARYTRLSSLPAHTWLPCSGLELRHRQADKQLDTTSCHRCQDVGKLGPVRLHNSKLPPGVGAMPIKTAHWDQHQHLEWQE
jgi:hypothetical protein